jgi:hypothetical protein
VSCATSSVVFVPPIRFASDDSSGTSLRRAISPASFTRSASASRINRVTEAVASSSSWSDASRTGPSEEALSNRPLPDTRSNSEAYASACSTTAAALRFIPVFEHGPPTLSPAADQRFPAQWKARPRCAAERQMYG